VHNVFINTENEICLLFLKFKTNAPTGKIDTGTRENNRHSRKESQYENCKIIKFSIVIKGEVKER
jgi:hypothetical protein